MPLESATYISSLVSTNPVHTDGLDNQDAHTRLIKTVLQNTFPNLSGAVTAAQGDLNAVTGILALSAGSLTVPAPSGGTTGASLVLAGNGTNAAISLVNTGTTAVLKSGTTTLLTADASGNASWAGTVNGSAIKQGGNVLIPTGMIMLWSGAANAIPAGWLLCNGLSGTPDLRSRFIVGAGSTYGVSGTGGAASVSPVSASAGAHSHGGNGGLAGGHTHAASTDSQGSHSHTAATGGHSLVVDEMPSHGHGIGATVVMISGAGGLQNVGFTGGTAQGGAAFNFEGSGSAHSHSISTDGAHSHGVTVASAADHQHSISVDGDHTHAVTVAVLPPYYALCYVMKS